ncbi:MAG: 50S ribosomal protein L18 [Candidatus Bathyarchaeota archaeon]|nr:50S ribosomal protein L18 [Candidatus Bathyarchaeota archaeon]
MARGSRYRVAPRRRREGKTDYRARKALVLYGKPRLVTRSTIKNFVAQIIKAKPLGDEVLVSAHSRELRKFGWQAPLGNVPAAYLTGLLCGLKAKAKGVEVANLDVGLAAPSRGSRIFAALSGVLDAGVEVPHDEEKIVKERLKGEHISKYAKSLGSGSEVYAAKFSKYLEQKLAPEKLPEHFAKVKAGIVDSFKQGVKKDEKETVKKAVKKRAKKA